MQLQLWRPWKGPGQRTGARLRRVSSASRLPLPALPQEGPLGPRLPSKEGGTGPRGPCGPGRGGNPHADHHRVGGAQVLLATSSLHSASIFLLVGRRDPPHREESVRQPRLRARPRPKPMDPRHGRLQSHDGRPVRLRQPRLRHHWVRAVRRRLHHPHRGKQHRAPLLQERGAPVATARLLPPSTDGQHHLRWAAR